MTPATILLLIQGIQAAIAAAPQAIAVAQKAKDLVSALFTANAITKEQQDALHAHIDGLALLSAQGIIPPHWKVEADPA
jgi:hypothetical protein